MTREIELLGSQAADDAELVAELCELVNRVYADAEAGLWREGAERIGASELARSIRAGEIAVMRVAGELVGSVRIRRLDAETGEFGLLVASPEHRGAGVGRDLVRFAEELSRSRGLSEMQLELLVPRDWAHPTKEFLHAWYTRLGYRIVGERDFVEVEPEAATRLAIPCSFRLYRRRLA